VVTPTANGTRVAILAGCRTPFAKASTVYRDPTAVDLARGVYYGGRPEASRIVLASPLLNVLVMGSMFAGFLFVGPVLFVRSERNR